MQEVRFSINISSEEYLAYYQGAAKSVIVTAEDGRRISFPAEHLRAHVSHSGVRGRFALRFDAKHRFVGLVRLAPQ